MLALIIARTETLTVLFNEIKLHAWCKSSTNSLAFVNPQSLVFRILELSKPSVAFYEDHYDAESWQCWPSAQLLQNSASYVPDNRESRYLA